MDEAEKLARSLYFGFSEPSREALTVAAIPLLRSVLAEVREQTLQKAARTMETIKDKMAEEGDAVGTACFGVAEQEILALADKHAPSSDDSRFDCDCPSRCTCGRTM